MAASSNPSGFVAHLLKKRFKLRLLHCCDKSRVVRFDSKLLDRHSPHEIAEVVGQRTELKIERVGGESDMAVAII